MKVSIYIVFNNYPIEWLKECIDGINGQTFTDYEVVVTLYGKNDLHKTLEALNELNCRILYRPDITNFVEAIRYTIPQCKGEYVIRADADDFLMPNAINRMYEYIEKEDSSIVIPNHINQSTKEVIKGNYYNWVCHALIEKDKYSYIKYLDGQTFRDGTSLIEAFKHYGFGISYIDIVGFMHRDNPNSITRDKNEVIRVDKLIKELYV
jgi:CDP-glycerol glycerophosphotransferase